MRLAFTLSSYRLVDFVKLGLAQLKKLAPDMPVLVSDDRSAESGQIENVSKEYGATYRNTKIRKGHFAGDMQSIITSLVFAEAVGADVAVKVSQRFIFRKLESVDVLCKTFEDPNIMLATPGRPNVLNGGKAQKGFNAFSILTDVVAIRVGSISADDLLVLYRARIIREKVPWKDFVENTIDELHANRFAGKSAKVEAITNPTTDPWFLRRYQATEQQYRTLALENGFNGIYPLVEWSQIEHRGYMCRPVVV